MRSASDSDVDMPQALPAHVHASDSEPESRDTDGLQERACELSGQDLVEPAPARHFL